MSNFQCEKCGIICYDSPKGYVTGCEHYPLDKVYKVSKMTKVAVYGTLRQGFHNHFLLEGSKFLGKTKTEPIFSMHGNLIPWVRPDGNTAITVEVYEVDQDTMRSLDFLEGYPVYYSRVLINTEFGLCWIYFRDQESDGIIESGDWAEYRQGKSNV
jgi:gamma-glutamylcyclotransferase (GGCT)/AIG2-like uncharacterized protein YtfP